MKPVIAITCGDTNGIGPEVALRASLHPSCRRECVPVLIGPIDAFRFYARTLRLPDRLRVWDGSRSALRKVPRGILPVFPSSEIDTGAIRPGTQSSSAGFSAARAIEEAVRLAARSAIDAIVTAPLSKQALHRAGYHYPGQTEMLKSLTSSRDVGMMLVSPAMRVALLTIHIPLRDVPDAITQDLVVRKAKLVRTALQRDWRIRRPRIAILGLNPHAGENGEIGHEEREIMLPAIGRLRRSGVHCDGPFSADGFFGRYPKTEWDAVIAAYHDQGLIPVKQSAGGNVVNVSIGLPLVRTSPGHGTAMDIAGTGMADGSATVAAVRTAVLLFGNRKRHAAARHA